MTPPDPPGRGGAARPALAPLLEPVAADPALARLGSSAGATVAVPESARAVALAALVESGAGRPVLVAVPTSGEAERLVHDLGAFLGPDGVELFPAWETLPFERVSPSVETMGRRLRTMWRLHHGQADVVVAPVRALVQRLGPHVDETEPVVVEPAGRLDPAELVAQLVALGYRRQHQVEHRGEVALRGSIVDVYPPTADAPVRIDLWGDEVDRLTEFSVADQRSRHDLERVELFACRELLPTDEVRGRAAALVGEQPWGREQWERLAEGLVFDGMESWLPWVAGTGQPDHVLTDLLGPEGRVVLIEPRRLADRAGDLAAEEADLARSLARTWDVPEGTELPRLHVAFDRLLARTEAPAWIFTDVASGPDALTVAARGVDPVVGDTSVLVERLRRLVADGYRVVVAADGEGSADRLARSLLAEGLTVGQRLPGDAALAQPGIHVVVAPLDAGFVLADARVAVLAEGDLTGRRRAHRRARPRRRETQGFFDDLQPGDHVVHDQHGVARYGGMVTRAIGGVERDYLLLEYRGADKLYVPTDQIDVVRRYVGSDSPTVGRLGGGEWQRARSRVRSAAQEIAQELVVLYQRRVSTPGHAFPPDTPWQRELEDAFPYRETPDQLQAIADVKADMEAPRPMDRLVCGDVGFGKTEVAVRAAFKAVQEGKQVAVLVPTTLLAQQHGTTFADRFAGYPVRVEVLSRFLTPGQARAVVEGLGDGTVDLVIGTHRLLSGDIRFKDLGLLVVDEEQRFGVNHKEAVKALAAQVDVLTLSATPIPRTLEMSLTGIRDLSLLNTPPAERQPILTYVGEYDERAVGEAIRRELLRDGQVFFVHNRVEDIERTAAELRELVPEAQVAVAHGQMDEGTLERVVLDFWEGRFDVLVCTTIIESGIDMPTVNTLVVDRADRLGLAQLHQLRGRVGRSGSRAYAYLFHPRDHSLSEEAYERLRTIGEATELGSGFTIAMRDLELRGAGNLLGESQSGHIAAVGYDLYVQMVTEAVAELKGELAPVPTELVLDLPVVAHLPNDYVSAEEQRLAAYRRLAAVETAQQVDDVRIEWVDRYGALPEAAEALLSVARLRAACRRAGVGDVSVTANRTGPGFVARLSPVRLRASAGIRLRRVSPKASYEEERGVLTLPLAKGTDVATALTDLLDQLVPVEAAPAR